MLALALDTASESGSLAVLRDDWLIGVVSTNTEETYSSRIFRQLEFLLGELSLSLDRFDLFAVNAGPGSFTGLRVGLTLAKAWAEVYGRPVAPIGGLEAVAAQCAYASKTVIPVLDARRGQVYAGSYRWENAGSAKGRLIAQSEDVVIAPEEFLVWLNELPGRSEATIATTSVSWLVSVLTAEACDSSQLRIRQVSPVLAPVIGALGYEKFSRGETIDALRLDAHYVRRSDAELHWKGK